METFIVICRNDAGPDHPGAYVLATRQVFTNAQLAHAYAASIATGREALVVEGRWNELRLPYGDINNATHPYSAVSRDGGMPAIIRQEEAPEAALAGLVE